MKKHPDKKHWSHRDHPLTFEYNGKTYDWWPMHPDNYTWEDGTQSCTPLQAQIERIKFIQSVEGDFE